MEFFLLSTEFAVVLVLFFDPFGRPIFFGKALVGEGNGTASAIAITSVEGTGMGGGIGIIGGILIVSVCSTCWVAHVATGFVTISSAGTSPEVDVVGFTMVDGLGLLMANQCRRAVQFLPGVGE